VADPSTAGLLRCGACGQVFTLRAGAAPAVVAKPAPTAPAPAAKGRPRLDVGAATSAGKSRSRNEDSLLVQHQVWSNLDDWHELALLMVADGLGGHEGGDRASGMTIRTLAKQLAPLVAGILSGQLQDVKASMVGETMSAALQEANRDIVRKGQNDPGCRGMGATVAAVFIWNGQALIGHVGDCRVYHYRGDRLTQVTRDQTLVNRMVELGQLTPEEASTHPKRNEVAQALGKHITLEPALYQLELAAGDWLVIACDGLHAHVDNPALQAALQRASSSVRKLAQGLVDFTNHKGGSDNCTVVAVHCY